MKIFIAHASEDANSAESLAVELQREGHSVFFDAQSLPDAEGYTGKIISEIESCDLFIFLISPDSVTEGRYTLTELKVAQKKWPVPDNRVLPVMLRTTPFVALPPYLASVTVLQPHGNPVAETVVAVREIVGKNKTNPPPKWPLPVLVTACLVALAAAAYWYFRTPVIVVAQLSTVELEAPSILGKGDSYLTKASFTNISQKEKRVDKVTIKVSDPGIFVDDSAWRDSFPVNVDPGDDQGPTSWLYFRLFDRSGPAVTDKLPPMTWQLCYWVDEIENCSPSTPFNVDRTHVDATFLTTPMISALRGKATAVLASGSQFFLTTATPNLVVRLQDTGQSKREQSTNGEPLDIGLGPYRDDGDTITALYVATKSPDAIEVFASDDLRRLAVIPIDLKDSKTNLGLTTTSTQPVQLAVDANGAIWIVTGGGTGKAGLAFYDRSAWVIPSYFPDFVDEARQLRLKSLDGAIWTVDQANSPSSLRLLTYGDSTKYDGTDFDVIACARDMAVGGSGHLILRNCTGDLVEIQTDQQKLIQSGSFGKIPSEIPAFEGPTLRITERLQHPAQPNILASYNAFDTSDHRITPLWTNLVISPENGDPAEVINLPDAETLDMAATPSTAIILLKGSDGLRDLVALRWKGE